MEVPLWYCSIGFANKEKPNSAALPDITVCMHYIFNIKLYKCKFVLFVCLCYWSKVLSLRVLIPQMAAAVSRHFSVASADCQYLLLLGRFYLLSCVYIYMCIYGEMRRVDLGETFL